MTAVAQTAPRAPSERAEPAVAPPPGNPRFPLVDGLRAAAALSVLVFHAAYLSGATGAWYGPAVGRLEIGVALFFAISGFLLYRPFLAARHSGPPVRVRDYLRRRVLRIVPAYWLALTVLAALPGLAVALDGDWWVYYGFGQIYSRATFDAGIPQAWTLCVEAAFYLALPFYALALARLGRGRSDAAVVGVEVAVLAALAAASLAFRTVAIDNGWVAFAWLPGMFGWFAPGMALAVVSVHLARRDRPWRPAEAVARRPGATWLAAAGLFALLAATVSPPLLEGSIYTQAESLRIYVLSAAVAVLVLLPAVLGGERGGAPRRLLALPALAWLGLISYGIYLWHQTLMVWLSDRGAVEWLPGSGFATLIAVTLVPTVAVAAASYYALERPVMRLKDRRRGRRAG